MTSPLRSGSGWRAGLLALALVGCRPPARPQERATPAKAALVPLPVRADTQAAALRLPAHVRISAAESLAPEARQLASVLGVHGVTSDTGPDGQIRLGVDAGLAREAYRLHVGRDHIQLQGGSAAGVFWGLQTLRQLLMPPAPGQSGVRVPLSTIEDAPRFAWRGVHLDVSRHFFSAAYVKRLIALMARYKLNVFHWHLTDDQGWRVPIRKHPRLTEIGAFREDRRHEPFWLPARFRAPLPAGSQPYGGFYSHDEIRDVVAFAARHHVTIVPEIDMPGHAQAALAAYPDLSCADKSYQVASGAVIPFSDPLCPCKPAVLEFARDVFTEVAALFPGPYIHIGGDEVNPVSWQQAPVCAAFRARTGLRSDEALAAHFVREVANIVVSLGRTPIGWEETLQGEPAPPPTLVGMAWQSSAPALTAARAGRAAIIADSRPFYLSARPADDGPGFAPLRRPYQAALEPGGVEGDALARILGVQASLWTEETQTEAEADEAYLPQLLALAETAWTPAARKSFADFARRLPPHMEALSRDGFTVFVPGPEDVPARRLFDDRLVLTPRAPVPGSELRYTLDGRDPDLESPRVLGPITVTDTTTVKLRTVLGGVQSRVFTAELVRAHPAPAAAAPTLAPGLCVALHEGAAGITHNVPRTPVRKRAVSAAVALPQSRPDDLFGLVFAGYLHTASSGIHEYCLTSNDGSTLTIAGQPVVDNDGLHKPRKRCGQIALAAGWHPLTLVYFEDTGSEHLALEEIPPGGPATTIAASRLAHVPTACVPVGSDMRIQNAAADGLRDRLDPVLRR